MPITGYTASLPTDIMDGAGVVYEGATVLGVTRGGVKFDPGEEGSNLAFDYKKSDLEGLDRVHRWTSVLSFQMLEMNVARMSHLEPGHTVTAPTGGAGYVPRAAGALATAATHYLEDIRVIWERGTAGLYVAIHFPKCKRQKWSLAGMDQDVAILDVELVGRALAATPTVCPFVIELRTALPA